MTKHLYRLATKLQAGLRAAAGTPPAADWLSKVARVEIDAWAALWRWQQCGEHVVRITEEQELAMLAAPLPTTLSMLAPLPLEALGIQLAEREDWIVVSRITDQKPVQVYVPQCWAYRQPVLLYCTMAGTALSSGFINLIDQPTIADLSLRPGTTLSLDGPRSLSEADITSDDYRLAIAIHRLYSPAK